MSKPTHELNLIDAIDQLGETRNLVEAAFMAAAVAGTKKQSAAMSRLLGIIADQLDAVDGLLMSVQEANHAA